MVASDKSEEVDVKESEQEAKAKEEEHHSQEDLEVEDITTPDKEVDKQR